MLTAGAGAEDDEQVLIASCDEEQIRIPGSIQPHGILLALDSTDLTVLQVSENVETALGLSPKELLGRPVSLALGSDLANSIVAEMGRRGLGNEPQLLRTCDVGAGASSQTFYAIAHRCSGQLILELEAALLETAGDSSLLIHQSVDSFMRRVEGVGTVAELCSVTCEEILSATGFDRVLVYQFDEAWNGTVLGEVGSGRLPSYLHHRFPASDIPAQARELYRLNRLRIIPDSSYEPIPLTPINNPMTGQPLDMSFATLRSVSPVHVQYMRNMETAASMSVSILREGKLWGLVSCHHSEPKSVDFQVRSICDLFAKAFSLRLSALEHTDDYERRIAVRSAYSKLLGIMADRGDFAAALAEHPHEMSSFTASRGAAILNEDSCHLLGSTPGEDDVRSLACWLYESSGEDVYSTDSLSAEFPAANGYKNLASGLLAIAISKRYPSFVMWFRPEVVQTIEWGGDPTKPAERNGEAAKLHPRRSFAVWRETVRDKSLPWSTSEIEGATELRNAIVGTVLRKAEELASLNDELLRSNKELESFSYSVSHDLRAPLRHIVGYAEMLKLSKGDKLSAQDERCVNTIIESSEYAGRLVDKLLGYARLGRSELQRMQIDLNLLVEEARNDVMRDAGGRKILWQVGSLPTVNGDLMMLRMAIRDLLSNAVKYTRDKTDATIEVDSSDGAEEYTIWVKDNGVGFDPQYASKLFGVFQRLHRWEDYEGTGIGLANVRRVVERHGGRTWGEGKEGEGATFFFTLPRLSE